MGTEWPDNTSESADRIPGQGFDAVGNEETYKLADFKDRFGLTLRGTVDLLAAGNNTSTTREVADSLPELATNGNTDYYDMQSSTDGDTMIRFLQEGYLETRNGVEEVMVSETMTGGDESDWLTAAADGITVNGAGGDDTLGGYRDNVGFMVATGMTIFVPRR